MLGREAAGGSPALLPHLIASPLPAWEQPHLSIPQLHRDVAQQGRWLPTRGQGRVPLGRRLVATVPLEGLASGQPPPASHAAFRGVASQPSCSPISSPRMWLPPQVTPGPRSPYLTLHAANASGDAGDLHSPPSRTPGSGPRCFPRWAPSTTPPRPHPPVAGGATSGSGDQVTTAGPRSRRLLPLTRAPAADTAAPSLHRGPCAGTQRTYEI